MRALRAFVAAARKGHHAHGGLSLDASLQGNHNHRVEMARRKMIQRTSIAAACATRTLES